MVVETCQCDSDCHMMCAYVIDWHTHTDNKINYSVLDFMFRKRLSLSA